MPPPASLGGCGSLTSPSSLSVLILCHVTSSDGDEKLNSSLDVAHPGYQGQMFLLGMEWAPNTPSCAEQGFRSTVCLDSIAALLHLSTGQSGTQDYETSSHEPLPRTPTCTTCKCQRLLSPFASSPCGNVAPMADPQSACGGQQGEGRGMLLMTGMMLSRDGKEKKRLQQNGLRDLGEI